MILLNKLPKKDSGFTLLEILIACIIFVLTSALIFRQIQFNGISQKTAEIKSTLSLIHQSSSQVAKKYEFLYLDTYIASIAPLNNCFKEAGTNCECFNATDPASPITCAGTNFPVLPLMHTSLPLSESEKEENALLNGSFNLDGTVCIGANCAIQNQTLLLFSCSATKCTDAKFEIKTFVSKDALNSNDKSILGNIPFLESTLLHDRSKSEGLSRTISSTCPASFSINPTSGQMNCDLSNLNNPLRIEDIDGPPFKRGLASF